MIKTLLLFLILILTIGACSPRFESTGITSYQDTSETPLDIESSNQASKGIPTIVDLPGEQSKTTPTYPNPPLSPTATPKQEIDDPSLGKVLLMFGQRYDYRQYEGVCHALEEANYRIVIASNTLEQLEAMYIQHGFESSAPISRTLPLITADLLLGDVQISDYDAFILISDEALVFKGGEEVKQIIREAIEQGKVVAAHDAGVLILGNAGILQGVEITSNPLICMQLEEEDGAICRQRTVHRDGQIITAGPDHASSSFVKQIIAAIQDSN